MTHRHARAAVTTLAGERDLSSRLQQLRQRIAAYAGPIAHQTDFQPHQQGFLGLVGGVRLKRLIELLEVVPGGGASILGLWLASQSARQRGELVVIDPLGDFYAPAAIAWGIDAQQLLLVRPASARDALAATEIALRSPAVSAVWATLGRIDGRAYRRLLLGAEAGNACGVLVRDFRHHNDPSWSDVQLVVEPLATFGDPNAPFLTRVTRRRNRHGPAGGEVTVAIDWRTGDLRDVTDAQDPTNPRPVVAGLACTARPA